MFLLLLTMALVSIGVFLITEFSPGNVARNVLGIQITKEQEASFLAQIGLDKPLYIRYFYWLAGSDWHASKKVGLPLDRIEPQKGFFEWWAVRRDGKLIRWKLQGNDLIAIVRSADGAVAKETDNSRWQVDDNSGSYFWGVDTHNHVVLWEKGSDRKVWTFIDAAGWKETRGGPKEYIPLKKGFLRGDPGISLLTGRPVAQSLFVRLRNSMILAGIAFIIVMPIAILLGLIASLAEGSAQDRVLSVGGLLFSVLPPFVIGIFLILIFSLWLDLLPGATALGSKSPWQRPDMLVLPVLTLVLTEMGYILRITRASMLDVLNSPYIRAAHLKGLPYWKVVFGHALRNGLIAPVTVIMLHINYLLGGIVVVEVVFGYPGLGKYLLDTAMTKDINALEAGAMILVFVSVSTQLFADIIYTFLNPRIRYS